MDEKNIVRTSDPEGEAARPELETNCPQARPETGLKHMDRSDQGDRVTRLEVLMQKVSCSGGMDMIQMDGFLNGAVCHAGHFPPDLLVSEILGESVDSGLMTQEDLRDISEILCGYYDGLRRHVEGKYFYATPLICPLDFDCDADFEDTDYEDAHRPVSDPEQGQEPEARTPCGEMEESALEADRPWEERVEDETAWAQAFLQALGMGGDLDRLASSGPERRLAVLVPVLMLAHNALPVDESSPEFDQPLTPEVRADVLRILPASLGEIYRILHSPVKRGIKLSRNDPCPCGSGRKYKKCCLGKPLPEQADGSVY